MKSICQIIIMAAVSMLFLASCAEDYGDRKESTPVIESASINPTTFTFGDEITLAALITDPATLLAALDYQVVTDGKIIASGTIPLANARDEVSQQIFIPLVSNQSDNAPVTVTLTAKNVLKGSAVKDVTGLTGKRPVYSRLYIVTDDGVVVDLTPQATNKDQYEATGLTLDRSFNYRIAEKITPDRQIDYSGAVWGNVNGRIAMIDANGAAAFAYALNADYMQSFVYDSHAYHVTVTGATSLATDLMLSAFAEETFDDEVFMTVSRTLEKNQEYLLIGKLGDEKIIYHLDFFERTAVNKIKFLGETGVYKLNYNTYRQHVIIGIDAPAYPDYLLITGGGIGYPTKVLSGDARAHCWWGFGNPRNFILMRKTTADTFQGTIFIHYDEWNWVGFKPYENTNWGGDGDGINSFSAFTVTGEDVLQGTGNWEPKDNIDTDAAYRLTIHWTAKTVHVEKITL